MEASVRLQKEFEDLQKEEVLIRICMLALTVAIDIAQSYRNGHVTLELTMLVVTCECNPRGWRPSGERHSRAISAAALGWSHGNAHPFAGVSFAGCTLYVVHRQLPLLLCLRTEALVS